MSDALIKIFTFTSHYVDCRMMTKTLGMSFHSVHNLTLSIAMSCLTMSGLKFTSCPKLFTFPKSTIICLTNKPILTDPILEYLLSPCPN